MVDTGRLRILASLLCVVAFGASGALSAPADAGQTVASGGGQGLDVLLAAALVLALVAVQRLDAARRHAATATRRLVALAQSLKAGEPPFWTTTGVRDVDDIARTLEEFDQRLRQKRALLTRLNGELIRSGGAGGANSFNNQLRAIVDALPVGVLLAEAPSGRILEGNRALETIRRGPVIYAEGIDAYRHWTAVHENGEPVRESEYPLARALAGEERPTLECRHQRGDGTWGWINIVGAPIRDENNAIIAAIVAVTDIDEIKNAEEQRRMMNRELHHRVNNSLAMIQGVANITARTAQNFDCFRDAFADRIQCLSRLSTLLVKNSWAQTPMRDVADAALGGDVSGARDRVTLTGEEVTLRSEVALALGMALHELFSNAARHGALSTDKGSVALDWRVADSEGRRLEVNWREHNGPPVEKPERPGVGQYLMKTVLCRQFCGDIDISYDAAGVRATLTAEI